MTIKPTLPQCAFSRADVSSVKTRCPNYSVTIRKPPPHRKHRIHAIDAEQQQHGNMSRKRCSIDGCQETTSLHRLPNNINICDQWLMFIYSEIPRTFSSTLTVCSAHFTSDCFVNLAQFNAGFSKKLLIKDSAVPTLLCLTSNPQSAIRK